MKQILLLSFLFTTSLYSQFDSLLFEKHLSPYKYGVVSLGDQNSDGFDDILVYDCKESKALIFFGGNPMDTIPDWQKTIIQRSIVAMDANSDSIKDIIIAYQDTMDSNQKGKVNIYFGGSLLDTIPDIHFEAPEWIGKNFGYNSWVINDFDGDTKSEFMIYDADYPFDDIRQFGIFYIYKSNPVFDTIPYKTIKGDTLNKYGLYPDNVTIGDLDGDG
ncbi:MAG TPA: hypothetical protein VLM39_11215, partial [Ignavibacteriaceae bacterium]|nr:hypothetical protein [Ignavibacteriaceae bacterium]